MVFKTLAALFSLLASAALLITGNALLQTLSSVHLKFMGVSIDVTALVLSGYYAGLILGSLRAPRVIARVGHIRSFAAFCALMTLAALLHPFVPAGYGWFGLRLLAGFAMAGLFVTIESWLSDRADSASRGTIFAVYMIINFAATGAGQAALGLGSPIQFELFSLAAMLFSLSVVPLSALRVEVPRQPPHRKLDPLTLYRISPLAFFGSLAVGLVSGAFYSLSPIFITGLGKDISAVSAFLGLAVLGGLVFQWPVGFVSDRIDRRWVLCGVAGMLAVTSAAMALLTELGQGLLICAFFYGGFASTLYPLSVAHAQDFAAPDQRAATSGNLLLVFGAGAVFGPSLGARAMAMLGPEGLFIYISSIAVALVLFALYRMRRRASPERREPFVAVTPTTPTATVMDPRHQTSAPTPADKAAADKPAVDKAAA